MYVMHLETPCALVKLVKNGYKESSKRRSSWLWWHGVACMVLLVVSLRSVALCCAAQPLHISSVSHVLTQVLGVFCWERTAVLQVPRVGRLSQWGERHTGRVRCRVLGSHVQHLRLRVCDPGLARFPVMVHFLSKKQKCGFPQIWGALVCTYICVVGEGLTEAASRNFLCIDGFLRLRGQVL
jgi:hypothetical protein